MHLSRGCNPFAAFLLELKEDQNSTFGGYRPKLLSRT
jgi:hypothetical protein